LRAVVQRVSRSAVVIDAKIRASIDTGLLVYLGVDRDDTSTDAEYLANKMALLRIFADEQDRMNLDVTQAGGEVLVVSAFTVSADARRGHRPSFDAAASGDAARQRYEEFCRFVRDAGVHVQTGVFGTDMSIESENAGPVCILLDSRKRY